jgi:hypothetical protein
MLEARAVQLGQDQSVVAEEPAVEEVVSADAVVTLHD